MCVALPIKIDSIDKAKNVFVQFDDRKIRVSDIMIKVKEGDYVYLHGNLILAKVNKQEVKKINLLFKK